MRENERAASVEALSRLKAEYTVRILRSSEFPLVIQHVEMGNRLSHCKSQLMKIQLTTKQDGQHVVGGGGCLTGLFYLIELRLVMGMLLLNATVQAGERTAVGRQHQRVGGQRQIAIERVQVALERIGLRVRV